MCSPDYVSWAFCFVCHQTPEPASILPVSFVGRALWTPLPVSKVSPIHSSSFSGVQLWDYVFLGVMKEKIFWLVKMIRQTLFRDVCDCCRISCIRSKRKWRLISQRTFLSGWREPRMDSCLGKASKVRARGPCWTDRILAKDGMHSWAMKNLISDRGEVLFLNWLSQAFVEAGFFRPTKLEGDPSRGLIKMKTQKTPPKLW